MQEQTDDSTGKTQEYESEETESLEKENPPEATGALSYLTGLPIEEEQQNKRPLAVMLSNIRASCPQTGIEKASIIYEAPVEGRITRLMGLFEDWESIEKLDTYEAAETILYIVPWNMMLFIATSDRPPCMWARC